MVFGTLRNTENTAHTNSSTTHHVIEKVEQQVVTQNRDVEMSTQEDDPILKETQNEYVIFPINYDDMWRMYKSFVDNFWSVQEHLEQFVFNEKETHFMKMFASFFASSSSFGLVNENFVEDFATIVQIAEAKFFYGHQLFIQNIHFEMYNKFFETLAKNENERNDLINEIESLDASKAKRELMVSCESLEFSEKLVASACLHGLLFTSINLIHDYIKRVTSNTLNNHELLDIFNHMIIDQDLERDFACLIVSHIRRKPSKDFIYSVIDRFASVEYNFLVEALRIPFFLGIKESEIKQQIDKRAAYLKIKLIQASETKMEVIYDKENEKKPMTTENKVETLFDHDF